jgi:hypothetical protein
MKNPTDQKNGSPATPLASVRLGLAVMSLAAATSLMTPYSSASSCCSDCGCPGGSNYNCCTLANGASCYMLWP